MGELFTIIDSMHYIRPYLETSNQTLVTAWHRNVANPSLSVQPNVLIELILRSVRRPSRTKTVSEA